MIHREGRDQLEGENGVLRRRADKGEKLHGRADRRHGRKQCLDPTVAGEDLEDGGRDDAEGPLACDIEVLEVVARVVLAQSPQAVPDLPLGGHHLEPQDQSSCVSVAKNVNAPGVGREEAADLSRALGRQAQGKQAIDSRGCGLDRRQYAARLRGERVVHWIDGPDAVEARERHEHVVPFGPRDLAAYEARVAPLRYEADSVLGTDAHDVRHLCRAPWPEEHRCRPLVAAAPLREVGSELGFVGDEARGANDGPESAQSLCARWCQHGVLLMLHLVSSPIAVPSGPGASPRRSVDRPVGDLR